MAKAFGQDGSDCEERKLGEQNGLDSSFAEKLNQKHAMRDVRCAKSRGTIHYFC